MPYATDDFNITGGDIDLSARTNWSAALNDLRIIDTSNTVVPNDSGLNACNYWDSDVFLPDQWSKAFVAGASGTAAEHGPAVRCSSNNYYAFLANTDEMYLSKIVGGSRTDLDSDLANGNLLFDRMYVEAVGLDTGEALLAQINGIDVLSDTADGSHDSGAPGLAGYGDSVLHDLNAFEAADFASTERVNIRHTETFCVTVGSGPQQINIEGGDPLRPKPKAVLLTLVNATTTESVNADIIMLSGIIVDQTQVCMGWINEDGVTPSNSNSWGSNTRALIAYDPNTEAVNAEASVGLGPGCIYIGWITRPPEQWGLTVTFFCGNDVDASLDFQTMPETANATTAVTIGFQADLILTQSYATSLTADTTDTHWGLVMRDKNSYNLPYDFDTGTASGPGSGEIRLNNATYSSATIMYVHDTDRGSTDRDAVLDSIQIGERVRIWSEVDSEWLDYEITSNTDSGTYHTFGINYINEESTTGVSIADAEDISLISQPFQRGVTWYSRNGQTNGEHHGIVTRKGYAVGLDTATTAKHLWAVEDIDSTSYDIRCVGTTQSGRSSAQLALGFNGACDFKLYEYDTPTVTGWTTDNNPGFRPQWAMYYFGLWETWDTVHQSDDLGGGLGRGFIEEAGQTVCYYMIGDDNYSSSTNVGTVQAARTICAFNAGQTVEVRADESTFGDEFTSTGVRLEFLNASSNPKRCFALAVQEAEPGITLAGKYAEDLGSQASPVTDTFDIGTRTDGLLVVGIYAFKSGGSDPITGVTWNSVSMNEDTSIEYATDQFIYVFSLANPSDGENTLSISHAGSTTVGYTVAWYDNVDQGTPLDTTNTASGSSGEPTVSVTPSQPEALVVSFYASDFDNVLTAGYGESELVTTDAGTNTWGMSYTVQREAAAQAMNWSNGGSNNWGVGAGVWKKRAAATPVRELLRRGRQILSPRSRL
jgi:hypothetical protein